MVRNRVSRRAFVQQTAVAGAGFWIAGRQVGYGQEKSPNAKVNVAVIGVEGRGGGHVNGLAGENMVALCDVDKERLGKQAKRFPNAKTYTDFRKMLEECKEIEAVSIATPDHTHAPAAAMALKMGKHVYCEKPLTHSIYEARVLTELAAKNPKLVTQMGNQGHSRPERRLLVEALQQGVIGKVTQFHSWTNRPIWPQGMDRPKEGQPVPAHLCWDEWLGPAPERPYHPAYLHFKWRGWWDFGTGALGDMACHIMDAGYWGLNLGYPVSVEAEGAPLKPDSGPKWMIVRQKFPARGDLPAVDVVWYDGGKLPPEELAAPIALRKKDKEGNEKVAVGNGNIFIGDKGRIVVTDEQHGNWKVIQNDGTVLDKSQIKVEQTIRRVGPGSDWGHFADWVGGIKGGPRPHGEFAYSGPFTEMVLIGIAAFRAQKKLDWDGPSMKAKDCPEVDPFIRREYRKGWTL